MLVVLQLLLNFPNTPSVVQLLGLTPSATVCDSQQLLQQPATAPGVVATSDGIVNQHESTASQVPVTSGSTTSGLESAVIDSSSLPSSSSSLDVSNTVAVFAEAAKSGLQPAPVVLQQDSGGQGDADSGSLAMKSGDLADTTPLYQAVGLQHSGGGDDVSMTPVTLLSNHTEAQLQELFRQQQWHVRLNQMMQLDVLQQQQQAQAAPLVIGADTAASLLWHQQQQQQHIANPTTVSFAFCNDQATQQQQQLLLQQQQPPPPPPPTSTEVKYDVQQQQVPAQMKSTATEGQQMQTQSSRQQKPRLIARGNRTHSFFSLTSVSVIPCWK